MDRVAASLPVISTHAETAEARGYLTEEAVAALVAAGVPRLYLPESLGGFATDPATCALACEAIAGADTAAAWHVMVYNAARLMAWSWPDDVVAELWQADPDTMVSASGHTPLRAERDGDELIVSGQNSFVSGCHHAKYMMGPLLLDDEPHMVIVPMSQCEIVDNWDTLGMRGSGSNDVRVRDVRVPAAFALSTAVARAPNSYYRGTLYQCPGRVVFATYVPVALSLAARAIDELENLALNKVPYASDGKLGSRPLAQQHYGRALGLYRSARVYFYDALEQTWERARRGEEFDERDRADLYLAGTHALQACAEAVRHVADAAGSSSLRRGEPLERICRDMEALRHHGFANESRFSSVAQIHLGAELDYPLLLR